MDLRHKDDGLVGSASTYWFDYTPSEIIGNLIDGSVGETAPLAGGGGGGGGAGISGGTSEDPFGGGGTYGQDELVQVVELLVEVHIHLLLLD